jgi:hypothetical protein
MSWPETSGWVHSYRIWRIEERPPESSRRNGLAIQQNNIESVFLGYYVSKVFQLGRAGFIA